MIRKWRGSNSLLLLSNFITILLVRKCAALQNEFIAGSLQLESNTRPIFKTAANYGGSALHTGNDPQIRISSSDSPLIHQLMKEIQFLKNEVNRLSMTRPYLETELDYYEDTSTNNKPPKRTTPSRISETRTRFNRSPNDYEIEFPEVVPSQNKKITETAAPQKTSSGSPEDEYTYESWTRLKVSPEELGSMPYGDFSINIYGHTANERQELSNVTKRYYYVPVCELNHKSAKSFFNNVTKKAQVRFRVEMWNAHISNSVLEFTSNLVGQRLKPEQIQVLPLEKVIITNPVPSTVYEVSKIWTDYKRNRFLWFTLTCLNEKKNIMIKDCDSLAEEMRTNPAEQFSHFNLKFALASQKSERRETVIKIDNVSSGKMMTELNQRFPGTKEVLLTAEDQSQLIMETATNVIMETFDESSVISENSEKRIYDILDSLMVMSQETITAQSAKMWDSVFWNEENYRPDKASRTLTELHNSLNTEGQKRLSDAIANSKEEGGGANVGFSSFSLGGNYNTATSSSKSMSDEELNRLVNESRSNVQWEGDRYTPKPMTLTRVNTGALKDSKTFRDKKVQVSYTNSMLSISIHINETMIADHFSDFNHIQNQLISMKNDLKQEISDLRGNLTDLKKEIIIHGNSMSVPIFVASVSPAELTVRKYIAYRKLEVGGEENTTGNQHGRLDLGTGIFRANTSGVYMFQFYTRVTECTAIIDLKVNGDCKASAVTQNSVGADVLAISSVLKISKGDEVGVVVSSMQTIESAGYTQFSGTLLRVMNL